MLRLPKATAWEHVLLVRTLCVFPFTRFHETQDERLLWPKEHALGVCVDEEELSFPLEGEGLVK